MSSLILRPEIGEMTCNRPDTSTSFTDLKPHRGSLASQKAGRIPQTRNFLAMLARIAALAGLAASASAFAPAALPTRAPRKCLHTLRPLFDPKRCICGCDGSRPHPSVTDARRQTALIAHTHPEMTRNSRGSRRRVTVCAGEGSVRANATPNLVLLRRGDGALPAVGGATVRVHGGMHPDTAPFGARTDGAAAACL